MTREEIVAMLERHIRGMELGQERIKAEQKHIDLALEEANDLLEWVRADDGEICDDVSECLDQA